MWFCLWNGVVYISPTDYGQMKALSFTVRYTLKMPLIILTFVGFNLEFITNTSFLLQKTNKCWSNRKGTSYFLQKSVSKRGKAY